MKREREGAHGAGFRGEEGRRPETELDAPEALCPRMTQRRGTGEGTDVLRDEGDESEGIWRY